MTIKWHYLILLSVFTLTACGAGPEITLAPPTITTTPISTELPVIATEIPAGFSTDNPIQIIIVPANAEQAVSVVDDFEAQLQDLTDVSITVALAETQAEATGLLCDSASGVQSAVWIDGMSYATSNLQGCGVGVLQLETSDGTGETGVLLLNDEYDTTGITGAVNDTLCRISVNDFYSWTLATVFYSIEGFSVLDIDDVNELDDNDALIEAVDTGTCASVGMSENAWQAYLDADEETREEDEEVDEDDMLSGRVVVAGTSPEIPFNVFAFPFSMSLDAIADIENALILMDAGAGRSNIENEDTDPEATDEPVATADELDIDADMMTALFGDGGFKQVRAEDFADLISFLDSSEINFAELGN
ncbi:MAG: hypothetical protein Phog2KO_08250 [Phototrophicaceae bacterium]